MDLSFDRWFLVKCCERSTSSKLGGYVIALIETFKRAYETVHNQVDLWGLGLDDALEVLDLQRSFAIVERAKRRLHTSEGEEADDVALRSFVEVGREPERSVEVRLRADAANDDELVEQRRRHP